MQKFEPPVSGDGLLELLKKEVVYVPIAEGLIYEEDSVLVSSAPGLGKSIIAVQMAMELSAGAPLFGFLHVPKKRRVWYIQMERSLTESLSRINHMSKSTDMDASNIYIDKELQAINWLRPDSLTLIVKRGLDIKPDIILLDPLYGIASGLSKDEVGSDVAKLLTIIKKELGCAIWLNHHTVKDSYDREGRKIDKEDPFYGAQWLKAHVTNSYLFDHQKDGTGSHWKLKKDSHFPKNLMKEIVMHFDEETGRSVIKFEYGEASDRLRIFLNDSFRRDKKVHSIEEICSKTTVSKSSFFKTITHEPFLSGLVAHKSKFNNTLYEVIKEI